MSVCPFMSKGPNVDDWCGCITTCELRINNGFALKILAQKAILDAKKRNVSKRSGEQAECCR